MYIYPLAGDGEVSPLSVLAPESLLPDEPLSPPEAPPPSPPPELAPAPAPAAPAA